MPPQASECTHTLNFVHIGFPLLRVRRSSSTLDCGANSWLTSSGRAYAVRGLKPTSRLQRTGAGSYLWLTSHFGSGLVVVVTKSTRMDFFASSNRTSRLFGNSSGKLMHESAF